MGVDGGDEEMQVEGPTAEQAQLGREGVGDMVQEGSSWASIG